MKIAIIGSGGVGGYFGAKLAEAGNEVTFLARGKHLQAIKENGIQVNSIDGSFTVDTLKATDTLNNMVKPDLCIVAVKAWQIQDIARDLKGILHEKSVVLPLQNGVTAVSELAEHIDEHKILGGLCRIISKIEAPGVIRHVGVRPTIVFGENDKRISDRVKEIDGVFRHAGINSKMSIDIQADLWRKFIAICVSGLLAVSKTTYGELRSLKETRTMMIDLFTEVYAVSQKAGIEIETDFVAKTVSFVDTFPFESTSSLTRDVWEGKPSEIEYQNGTVVKLGEKYGVPVPVNRFVYGSLVPGELKARGQKIK